MGGALNLSRFRNCENVTMIAGPGVLTALDAVADNARVYSLTALTAS